jgi:hypothetical protein
VGKQCDFEDIIFEESRSYTLDKLLSCWV